MSNKMTCPLCSSESSAILKTFQLSDLAKLWKKNIGFNPFVKTTHAALEKRLCVNCGLVHFYPQIIGDATFYSELSTTEGYYPDNKWEFDKAIDIISQYKPASILEIGCGEGYFLSRIATCADRVLGIDINSRALAIAEKKGLKVSNKSIEEIEEKFDMIVLFQVLEHLELPMGLISEAVKKLNSGGVLMLAVPNPDGFLKHVDVHILDMPPHHATIWSKKALCYLVEQCGLSTTGYDAEPIRFEHLRAQLFSQINQDQRMWGVIKFMQKISVLLCLPILYMLHKPAENLGQTHMIVAKKVVS
ncbi:MAG: class I SAM-dependent methyltransferase [Gallionella sp.]|jgi:SAM-dependent methyltransferase